ncbi:PTS sugar transporter subunit IIA [Corynebacterium sp. 335C]
MFPKKADATPDARSARAGGGSPAAPDTAGLRDAAGSRETAAGAPAPGAPVIVGAPLSGRVVPLSEVPDPVFAAGRVGEGVAIDPDGDVVTAPADGKVVVAFPTAHAIGLRLDNGATIIVHVGVNTVELAGRGFEYLVAKGEYVTAGQPLLRFDRAAIEAAGLSPLTPVVVENHRRFRAVTPAAEAEAASVRPGDPLLRCELEQPKPRRRWWPLKSPTSAADPEADVPATVVTAPVEGHVVPLSDVPDAAFAGGHVGRGLAIDPRGEEIVAPGDGVVAAMFPTGHAIALRLDCGVQLIVHVGVDTADMGGEGFAYLVEQGDRVTAGQPLLRFDRAAIKAAGHSRMTPVIVVNHRRCRSIEALAAPGPIRPGEPLLEVVPKASTYRHARELLAADAEAPGAAAAAGVRDDARPSVPDGPDAVRAHGLRIPSPMSGTVVDLADLPDPVFAAGRVGHGVAIEPDGDVVVAPQDCEVVMTVASGHAIGLKLAGGVQLLVHVGLGTVDMPEGCFDVLVRNGEHVAAGQPVLRFDRAAIAEAGLPTASPVVIANHRRFGPVTGPGAGTRVEPGDMLLALAPKDGAE